MTTDTSKALPPEVRERAEALVRKYFAQCFWPWKRNATIETSGKLLLVVRHLREYGGREGWRDASELLRCL